MRPGERVDQLNEIVGRKRDGCRHMFPHPVLLLARYSPGVSEFIGAGGCPWMFNVLVEPLKIFREASDFGRCSEAVIDIASRNGSTTLELNDGDGVAWKFRTFATLPDGRWQFIITRGDPETGRGDLVCLLLPSEK